MSTAANLPPRSKRLSLRIADLGIPIPPRVQQFLDTPEVERYEGARAWGLEGFDGDSKLKVRWVAPRLADFHDYACEMDRSAAAKYLPIAALGSETRMFAVDVSDPKLAVYVFDYESGYKKWADDFELFLNKLLRKGEKTPTEKLDKAHELASEHNQAKEYPKVLEVLLPVVARFPTALPHYDDARDTLGAAYNLIGIAHEKLKDIPSATAAYDIALALGCDSAGLNICDLLLDHHKDYAKLVEVGEKQRESIYAFGSDNYAWFHIRNYLGRAYLMVDRPRDAIRAYHQILDGVGDPAKLKEAIDDLRELRDRPGADTTAIDNILSWLDRPQPGLPADRLAALRAWWKTVPEPARTAIVEAAKVTGEPTDDDFGRIARLTDLEIEHTDLDDLAWVTALDRLEDLDLEDNEIVDLSPLASLRRLRRLDVGENNIKSLQPLATLSRLEWLSCDDNPLESLHGLENLRALEYVHATECKLSGIEPLRGLPELEEVTIYNNQIEDLSPLSESPRLKEISSFGNPVARGLASLGKLRWLESVDAGDDTDPADAKALRAANARVELDHYYPDDDDDKVDIEPTPDPTLRAWWNGLSDTWKKAFAHELGDDEAKNPSDEALWKLVREDHISIDDKPLPDLEPMRRFALADYLNFSNTGIVDLSPLSRLPSMRDLIVRDNKIDLATLAPAEVLEELFIERCGVTSLAGLSRCRALRELYAEDNAIEDLSPLAGLADLRILDLEGNRVVDLAPLATLPQLRALKLGLNRVVDLSPLAACKALREIELWGNPPLRNGLALAELPDLAKLTTHGALSRDEIAELRKRRPDIVID